MGDGPQNAFERVLASTGRVVEALRVTAVEGPIALSTRRIDDDPLGSIKQACCALVESGDSDPSKEVLLRDHCSGLGGARPKAAVIFRGQEVIAKFQNTKWDYWDIPRVEAACLATARYVGFDVANGALVRANDRSVLLVDQFGRRNGRSIHYLSALSLLNAFGEGETETLPPKGARRMRRSSPRPARSGSTTPARRCIDGCASTIDW